MFGVAAFLFATLAFAAPGPTYVDPAGDVTGAPDVKTVAVTADSANVTFTVRASGSWTDAAAILRIDTDGDPSTGNAFSGTGFEAVYVLHSLHDLFTLERSNGVTIDDPGAGWNLNGSTLSITTPLSELAVAGPTIGFRVSTPAAGGEDEAPDSSLPEWQFSPGAKITSIAATFAPRSPRHGASFALTRVTTRFSDGNTGTAPPKCAAKLGRVKLRGSCRWHLPARARGKKLTVAVTAAGKHRSYSFRVR
jgi:hypothetical protein